MATAESRRPCDGWYHTAMVPCVQFASFAPARPTCEPRSAYSAGPVSRFGLGACGLLGLFWTVASPPIHAQPTVPPDCFCADFVPSDFRVGHRNQTSRGVVAPRLIWDVNGDGTFFAPPDIQWRWTSGQFNTGNKGNLKTPTRICFPDNSARTVQYAAELYDTAHLSGVDGNNTCESHFGWIQGRHVRMTIGSQHIDPAWWHRHWSIYGELDRCFTPPPPPIPPLIFADGFESGDLESWTVPPLPPEVFADGFESGDLSAWRVSGMAHTRAPYLAIRDASAPPRLRR